MVDDKWMNLWLRSQRFPLLHAAAVSAYARAANRPPAVLLQPARDPVVGIVLEQRSPGLLMPISQPDPLVIDLVRADAGALLETLERTQRRTGVRAFMFSLVDASSQSARLLATVPRMVTWSRTPSPTVSWTDRGNSLWSRVCERHGSQAERKRRRFEREMNVVNLGSTDAKRAVDAIAHIEAHSWKRAAGLDLLPGQLEFFRQLVVYGQAFITVATMDDVPVAYRVDAHHGGTVYTVRWSYDDSYRRYAPGFYLLTKGLVERWGTVALERIHLMGHPDTLKALVEDGIEHRADFVWPEGDHADQLRQDAVAYDRRRADQYREGVGLRQFYKEVKPATTARS